MKQTSQQQSIWGFRSLSFWLTLLVAVGIILVGIRFFISPLERSQDFGIPFCEGKTVFYGYVKGIRDIFSGLVFLYLLAIRARRTMAVLFSLAILIPMVDGMSVFLANGAGDWHWWIHVGTALYMGVTSIFLFKTTSGGKS